MAYDVPTGTDDAPWGMEARFTRPHEVYPEMRAQCPVHFEPMTGGVVIVERGDVEAAFRSWQDFSSAYGGVMGSEEPIIPLNVDPPLHVKYRRILDPYFAPKRMVALQPAVEQHTSQILDAIVDAGACDFSTTMAVPLPCSTFLTLLGLPLDELDALVQWKDIMIRANVLEPDPVKCRELQARTARDIYARFTEEIAERRRSPRDDLITYLTRVEHQGESLTESEILRTCFLMLSAGLDTVTVSLECMFAFLVRNDDARRMLVEEPGSEVPFVEELLRWESPVQVVSRVATHDYEFESGGKVEEGQKVTLAIGSANIDPEGAPGADTVDVRRRDLRSLAFGGGPHRCLGSNLARMELRTVVRQWHDRIPEYSLAPGAEIVYNGSALRGVDHLPLVWSPSTTR